LLFLLPSGFYSGTGFPVWCDKWRKKHEWTVGWAKSGQSITQRRTSEDLINFTCFLTYIDIYEENRVICTT
jgi:hypothetical protein